MTLKLFFDGGTKGNRICVVRGDSEYNTYRARIRVLDKKQTSNQLEYSALLFAIRTFKVRSKPRKIELERVIEVIGDSELVIGSFTGKKVISSPKLIDLYEQIIEEIKARNLNVLFIWVPRAENLAGLELEKK